MKHEPIRATKNVRVDPEVEQTVLAQMRARESFNDVLRRLLGLDIEQRGEQGRPDRRQRAS